VTETTTDLNKTAPTMVNMAKRKAKRSSANKSLLAELWGFLRERKAWWLTPIIVMLVIVGVLIVLGQSSAVSPFIYALF